MCERGDGLTWTFQEGAVTDLLYIRIEKQGIRFFKTLCSMIGKAQSHILREIGLIAQSFVVDGFPSGLSQDIYPSHCFVCRSDGSEGTYWNNPIHRCPPGPWVLIHAGKLLLYTICVYGWTYTLSTTIQHDLCLFLPKLQAIRSTDLFSA